MADHSQILERLRATFASGVTKSRTYRINQLKNLQRLYEEGQDELVAALKADLGKPSAEAVNFEVDFNKNFVRTTLDSLDKYEHTY
jgi:aldehyde dehydrogenase (NAD+)